MEPLDWSDGDYARTAASLAPASEAAVSFAGIASGDRLLDVGCGSGNAALAAAARGARVTGVDPSSGLLEQAADRFALEGIEGVWLEGPAEALPVPDASFEVALSVFGVIFSPQPAVAVSEMARAVRPGGTVAVTGWERTGPISAAGGLVADALDLGGGEPRHWGERDWVAGVLEQAGLEDARFEAATLSFTADSPQAWWREQEGFHPLWRWAGRQLAAERWEQLHADTVELLAEANEDPSAFRATSGYLLSAARVP